MKPLIMWAIVGRDGVPGWIALQRKQSIRDFLSDMARCRQKPVAWDAIRGEYDLRCIKVLVSPVTQE